MDPQTDRRQRFEALNGEVFEPLQRYLRRRIHADLVDDVLSDVLLTVWRRLDDIPSGRELPWCYGVARRSLANQRRSQSRHLKLLQRLESEPSPRSITDPNDSGPDAELASGLETLGRDDRELLHLWAWEQLEPREIAQVLGITINAATLRLSRARKRLQHQLTRQNSSPTGHELSEDTQEQT